MSSSASPGEPGSPPKYRADIDGLRAIAVMSVVAFHAFPDWLTGGFVGVDIFFVISGFLISSIIFAGLESSRFSFFEFYARRIRRIFPALLAVLCFCLLAGWFTLLASEFAQLGKHIAGSALFLSNLLLRLEASYFDRAADTKQLLHLWSLGIEEQFYIVWPAILWFAWKKRLNLLTVALVIGLISFLINVRVVANNIPSAFYMPQSRFWELLLGSVLAYVMLRKAAAYELFANKLDSMLAPIIYAQPPLEKGVALRSLLSVAGCFSIAIGLLFIRKDMPFPGSLALFPTLGTLLLLTAGPEAWLNRKVLAHPFLVWFGLISFPLYLWHWPLLSFLRVTEQSAANVGVGLRLTAVAVSIGLAWLTFRFLETPIRGATRHKFRINTALVCSLAIVGVTGLVIFKLGGLPGRHPVNEKLVALFDSNPHAPNHNENCDARFPMFKQLNGCKISGPGAPQVLILGDSHSQHYYLSMAKALPSKSVMNVMEVSCFPFSSDDHLKAKRCAENLVMATKTISEQRSIETIYLGGHWAYLMSGGFGKTGASWRLARELLPDQVDSFKRSARVVLRALVGTGKNIVFIKDNPDFAFSIPSCFKIRPVSFINEPRSPCAMERHEYEQRMKPYEAVVNELLTEYPTVKVFDPRPILCGAESCSAILNDQLLFINADHLTVLGGDLVVGKLLAEYPAN